MIDQEYQHLINSPCELAEALRQEELRYKPSGIGTEIEWESEEW